MKNSFIEWLNIPFSKNTPATLSAYEIIQKHYTGKQPFIMFLNDNGSANYVIKTKGNQKFSIYEHTSVASIRHERIPLKRGIPPF